jgi:hypothetical protein
LWTTSSPISSRTRENKRLKRGQNLKRKLKETRFLKPKGSSKKSAAHIVKQSILSSINSKKELKYVGNVES